MEHSEATTREEQHEEEEHIHLPPPSWTPIVLALGMSAVAFGVVLGGIILVIGAILLFAGLGTWVYDEIRNASAADEQTGENASHSPSAS